ncbi:heme exporter protein CcmB [Thiomicrospira microaerophila]|uniref:heme exporter protein CcmB n=1 Tax=Thiomicrospira microaerophila TaxID=406020 RepID=UPI0006960DE5|nr:heme exporter protein CcmB [Thiomicrospira microaerophila]
MRFVRLVQQQLSLAYANKLDWLTPLLFFALVIILFPLALGGSPQTLAAVAPGLLWVAALLATLLSLDSMFRGDHDDGTLELWAASQASLLRYTYAKLVSHWLLYALPLVVLSPLLGYGLHLPVSALPVLVLSLVLGSLSLVWIGAVGVAITSGIKYNSFLLALLVLPFYMPILIFGASAVDVAAQGWSALGPLYLLAALAVLSVTLAPLAVAKALKLSLN